MGDTLPLAFPMVLTALASYQGHRPPLSSTAGTPPHLLWVDLPPPRPLTDKHTALASVSTSPYCPSPRPWAPPLAIWTRTLCGPKVPSQVLGQNPSFSCPIPTCLCDLGRTPASAQTLVPSLGLFPLSAHTFLSPQDWSLCAPTAPLCFPDRFPWSYGPTGKNRF